MGDSGIVVGRRAGALVGIVDLLNDEFANGEGAQMAGAVLATLAALLAGNDSARKRLAHDVRAPPTVPGGRRALVRGGYC